MKFRFLLYFAVVLLMAACRQESRTVQKGEVVNVYTSCYQKTDDQLFENFENATGIKVNLIYGSAGTLIDKLRDQPAADLLILKGICHLQRARKTGILKASTYQPDFSYPQQFQDSVKYWYPLTYDPFVIAYLQDSMAAMLPATYADLAKKQWEGKLLLPADHDCLHTFTVAMLAEMGEEATLAWLRQYRENLVMSQKTTPNGKGLKNDSIQLALINASHYLTTLKANPVNILFPNQAGKGTYATMTGIGVVQSAPHPGYAKRLLVYLLNPEIQRAYARLHHEYPASTDVQTASLLQELGSFKLNSIPFSLQSEYCDRASLLMQETGF